MGLLSKLKSLLGMEEERRSAGSGVDVTVEREPSAESERAVKESTADTDGESGATEDAEDETDAEPVATETDAAASTESLVDEEHTNDPTRAAEPAEAAVTEDDGSTTDPEASEETEESTADEADESAAEEPDEPTDGNTESVSTVKGIGPAYAERLADAGVETVADLAAADPDELAERVDLSPKRVGRWVDSAKDHN